MHTELRKRLEEAAEGYAESLDYVGLGNSFLMDNEGNSITQIYTFEQIKDAYEVGAEHGYKEAIEVAKEWMKENGYLATNGWYTIKGTLADFESDMNKLWEEQK